MDQQKLRRVLDEHKLWLESSGSRGQAANLKGADLSGVNFREHDLRKANLKGVKLCDSNLNNANIQGSNLAKADLSGAQFQGADLQNVNLWETKLTGTVLASADLSGANLGFAELRGADLEEAILWGANLSMADLTMANFKGAQLQRSDLYKAKLEGTNFERATLHRIKIDRETIFDLPQEVRDKYERTFFIYRLLDNNHSIIRSVEFYPEFHKAGLLILHTFGDVVRNKFPESKVKIRIEQEGLRVRMMVEVIDGDHGEIERALNQYGLVVTGKMPIEQFTDDPELMFELKNELKCAQAIIESKRELSANKRISTQDLNRVLLQAIQNHSQSMRIRNSEISELDCKAKPGVDLKN